MRNLVIGCAVATMVALSAKSEARPPASFPSTPSAPMVELPDAEVGLASWYGAESQGTTSSGELYDMNKLTAAHRTLPLGSKIRVTNLKNNRSLVLRVNDRGPNVLGRLLDVSKAAAQYLGFIGAGMATVKVTVVAYPKGYIAQASHYLSLRGCVRRIE
ncbi:MAG: septal ring lytic transglycosylase RlpA family protein [Terriglobia bacterium]